MGEVDRTSKPSVKKKAQSDLEDGYEPVGKPIDVITAVMSHGKQVDNEDAAVRNIENRDESSAIEHIIHKETIMKDFGNYNDHLSDENVVHLQRNLNSDKPTENCLTKKELKKKKAEEEKLLKEEKKRLKQQKEKEEREEKQKQKLLKKEEKLVKEREMKLKKEKSKQETKEIQHGKEDLNNSQSESKNKSIIDTMIDKVRKLSTEDKEDKEVPVSDKITSTNENENNEKRKSKLEKEEER